MDKKGLATAPPAKARRRFTTEEKHAIFERYRASGLSRVRFAWAEGIALATLTRWLRKERDVGVNPEGAETPVEVVLPAARVLCILLIAAIVGLGTLPGAFLDTIAISLLSLR